jgi:transmembrane sensor
VDKDYIGRLLEKYYSDDATHAEREALYAELQKGSNDPEWEDMLSQMLQKSEEDKAYRSSDYQGMIDDILRHRPKVVTMQARKRWMTIAAAAVILLAVSLGSILLFNRKAEKQVISRTAAPVEKEIAPGKQGAVLTLANGKQIILDTAHGKLANENGVAVINAKGIVSYDHIQSANSKLQTVYNTISTPRGRQYQLILEDGSKVWLNAASSIRFPTSFSDKERAVEITGEAYFEVAHNPSKPFIVSVNDMKVEVLGTHFNINSYSDEALVKTTLLEGAVKVTKGGAVQMLSPGQQAGLNAQGEIRLNKNADVEEAVAWKNGKFQFGESADIATIMRQISRWYDVEVEIKGTITEHIGGTVSRNVNLSKVFEMLEMTGIVKFETTGNKVIVTPQKK